MSPRLHFLRPLACALLAAGAARADLGAPPERDLTAALAELASASGEVRSAAERWIGAHVERDDYPALARAAESGGSEVRERLARALGGDARHFGLAVLFLAERDAALRAVGAGALERQTARWCPGLDGRPLLGLALVQELEQVASRLPSHLFTLAPERSAEAALEELAATGALPLGWAIEDERALWREPEGSGSPGGAEAGAPGAPFRGDWPELLARLAEASGTALQGHGLAREAGELPGGRGFVLLARPLGVAAPNGITWCARWCLRLAGPPSRDRTRAACNLARVRWPAALAWLERRWLDEGDADALEGLLCAAAEGRVAPALWAPATIARVVAEAEARVAAREPEARAEGARRMRALAALGRLAPDGTDLAARLSAELAGASPRGRWVRLTALAAWGAELPDPAAVRASALVAGSPRPLAEAGLAAWTAYPLGPGEPGEPGGGGSTAWGGAAPPALDPAALAVWLGGLADEDAARRWTVLLARSGARPPEPWRAPAGPPGRWSPWGGLALALWHLQAGEADAAAGRLAAVLGAAGGPEGAAGLEEAAARSIRALGRPVPDGWPGGWPGGGPAGDPRDGFLAALGALRPASAARLADLLGRTPEADLEACLARATGAAGGGVDAAVLGVLAGRDDDVGARARGTLLPLLGSEPPSEAVLRAVQAASDGLFARRADELAEGFLADLERQARTSTLPWARAVRAGGWPLPPGTDPRPLGEREPRLEPGGP